MRSASTEYLNNMFSGNTVSKSIVGRIEEIDSERYVEFDDSNLVKKSFTYVNQCTADGKFTVGGVYAGKLQVTLTGIPTWIGEADKVRIRFTIKNYTDGILDEFSSQWFIVDKLSQKRQTINTQVTLTAYDYMTKLDRPMSRGISGENAYSVFSVICQMCGIACGNDASEMLIMPNATEYLFVDPADCPTYRDAVQQIATLLCGYATMNSENKLEIKQFDFGYHVEPARQIPKNKRIKNGTVTEGIVTFNDVHGITYNFSGEEVVLGAEDVGYGVLDFGYIYIVPRNISNVSDPILTAWRTFAQNVRYEVQSCSIVPDFSWELGDRLRLGDASVEDTFISKMVYRYSEAMEIAAEGETEASANTMTADMRNDIRSGTQVGKNTMVSIAYTNADDLNISHDEYVLVSLFRFAALESTHVMMNLMLPIVSDADGDVDVKWNINGYDGDEFLGHIERGNNLVTLAQEYEFAKNDIVLMRVYARSQFYETDNRRQQAHIVSIENYIQNGGTLPEPVIDTSDPNFFIGAQQIRSFIWAKGLDAGIKWDGFLFVQEDITYVPFGEHGIIVNSESGSCRVYPVRVLDPIEETTSYQSTSQEMLRVMDDTVSITFTIAEHIPRCGEGYYCGQELGSVLL